MATAMAYMFLSVLVAHQLGDKLKMCLKLAQSIEVHEEWTLSCISERCVPSHPKK